MVISEYNYIPHLDIYKLKKKQMELLAFNYMKTNNKISKVKGNSEGCNL